MGFYMTSALFMTVCEMTKDQIKAQSFGHVWSLTIEPLWNKLTLDIQVLVFTYISLFNVCPLWPQLIECSYITSTEEHQGEKMRRLIKT